MGRITQTTKNVIDNSSSVQSRDKIIAQNSYDALGQLKTKKLGVAGSTTIETLAYDYNIRGWLLGMNRNYVNSITIANKFGYELTYDRAPCFSGSNFQAQYNGNISGMSWRGKSLSDNIRHYEYRYDAANRTHYKQTYHPFILHICE